MIHFVIGTRAQLFKMAPIMLECKKQKLKWRWIYTAQHKDTIENTIQTFGLPPPAYVLFDWSSEAKTMRKIWYWFLRLLMALPRGRKVLGGYTGKKHIVLTHGDTITTWWGALVGRLFRCRVMHVESGLRSFNLFKPFPEEINRLITFRLSNIYACPGDWAVSNLRKYKGDKLNTKQNTQIDTLMFGLQKCEQADLKIDKKNYAVTSIHRYENIFDEKRFELIIDRILDASKSAHIYWVQHPVTLEQLIKLPHLMKKLQTKNITILPRLEYLQFIKLVKHCQFVITDGGGNQEELYFLGKPTLIFRSETERQEGLGKNAVLAKFDDQIIANFLKSYKSLTHAPIKPKSSPSRRIVKYLADKNYGR